MVKSVSGQFTESTYKDFIPDAVKFYAEAPAFTEHRNTLDEMAKQFNVNRANAVANNQEFRTSGVFARKIGGYKKNGNPDKPGPNQSFFFEDIPIM